MVRVPFASGDRDFADLALVAPRDAETGPISGPLPAVQTEHTYNGNSGNNSFNGTSGGDVFNMASGGNDTVHGNGGDDIINFGNSFKAGDVIRGGSGFDTLNLSGSSYAGGLTITSAMLEGVDWISLGGGNSYNFTLEHGVLTGASGMEIDGGNSYNFTLEHGVLTGASGMEIDGRSIGAGHHLIVDASALDSGMRAVGGAGNDTLTGGAAGDLLGGGIAGDDVLTGGAGDDTFLMDDALTAADRIYGGNGFDSLALQGSYAGLTLGDNTISGIDDIVLNAGYAYRLTLADGNTAAGEWLEVDGSGAGHRVVVDGSAEANGMLALIGGTANDTLTGGNKGDQIEGGPGADRLTGGAGADDYYYHAATDSFGATHHDTIVGFDANQDLFRFPVTVTGVNAQVVGGTLNNSTFDSDLTAALAGHLGNHHAVIFKPNDGDYAGQVLVIVDQNGSAGYQGGGGDAVMVLEGAHHLANFSLSNFFVP